MDQAGRQPCNPCDAGSVMDPVTVLSGRTIQNRLVKVAMYEHMASMFGGQPNQQHFSLYSKWSKYPWGMTITGNVQVSPRHLSLGRDLVVPISISEKSIQPFRELASTIHGGDNSNTLAIMQLSHGGRQSGNIIGGRLPFVPPLAPSAIRVGLKSGASLASDFFNLLLFQTPRAMSLGDIDRVVDEFVRGSLLAVNSGFDGVELHVAHGYLLAQFMSPKSNTRTDEYSTIPDNALRLLHRIVSSIRSTVPSTFVVGIKFNAGDYVDAALDSLSAEHSRRHASQEIRALEDLRTAASWGTVDFIEISGGDYESPEFMSNTSPRQALFSHFSRKAMEMLSTMSATHHPLILLTGGLRSPGLLDSAIRSKHAHLLGIGRPSILCPSIPEIMSQRSRRTGGGEDDFEPFAAEPDLTMASNWIPRVPLVGAGMGMAWYIVMMRRLANGLPADYSVSGLEAVVRMWLWLDAWTVWVLVIALAVAAMALYSTQ